ncbi:hypothetical protein ISCGN_001843 [Ixodes scapularis]
MCVRSHFITALLSNTSGLLDPSVTARVFGRQGGHRGRPPHVENRRAVGRVVLAERRFEENAILPAQGEIRATINKKKKPRAVRAFQEQGCTRERLVRGTGSSTGDGPQKAIHNVFLSARRWGEGAGQPGQRSAGEGGVCKRGRPAASIAIFFLLLGSSG